MRPLLFVLITLLMFFLPNRLLTTEPVHEYLGCALLVLGGVHLWLERAYLRALFRRRLPMTALNTVNIIMLLLLAVTLVSGILISLRPPHRSSARTHIHLRPRSAPLCRRTALPHRRCPRRSACPHAVAGTAAPYSAAYPTDNAANPICRRHPFDCGRHPQLYHDAHLR